MEHWWGRWGHRWLAAAGGQTCRSHPGPNCGHRPNASPASLPRLPRSPLHLVALAARRPLPSCIAGERHCPPEFCAGVWGYEDLLDRRNDPEDPDYAELWEQTGYDFDPEKFNLEAANQRLQSIATPP